MHRLHFLILETTLKLSLPLGSQPSFSFSSRGQLLIFVSLSPLVRLYRVLSFTFQWGNGETGTQPERSKMMKWLENWSLRLGNKKRPRDWRLFSLEKKSLKSHLIAFKHMKGS